MIITRGRNKAIGKVTIVKVKEICIKLSIDDKKTYLHNLHNEQGLWSGSRSIGTKRSGNLSIAARSLPRFMSTISIV